MGRKRSHDFRVIDGGRKPINCLQQDDDVFMLKPVDEAAMMAWIDSALWEAAGLLHKPGRRADARRLVAAALGAISTLPPENGAK